MDKVKDRDKDAFAFVFRFYAPKLKQFAYKHVGNEQVAMEMVQETMATVWQKAHLYDGEKSALSTWIYTIIRNLCFDLLRKQKGKNYTFILMTFGRQSIIHLILLITIHQNKIC